MQRVCNGENLNVIQNSYTRYTQNFYLVLGITKNKSRAPDCSDAQNVMLLIGQIVPVSRKKTLDLQNKRQLSRYFPADNFQKHRNRC